MFTLIASPQQPHLLLKQIFDRQQREDGACADDGDREEHKPAEQCADQVEATAKQAEAAECAAHDETKQSVGNDEQRENRF
jgi:hypothetical protein